MLTQSGIGYKNSHSGGPLWLLPVLRPPAFWQAFSFFVKGKCSFLRRNGKAAPAGKRGTPTGGEVPSSDLHHPALGVRELAPLDAGEGVVELLGQGADALVAHVVRNALVVQLLDGDDHGGSAGGEDLLQAAVSSASTATATGRSNPDPDFLIFAGARLTVIRLMGSSY